MPSDPLTLARADSVYFAAEELAAVNPLVNVYKGETFAAKKEEFFETFPQKLKRLAAVHGASPFFCGNTPTFADFNVWHYLDNARMVVPTALDGEPSVLAFMDKVAALPEIDAYLQARPDAVDVGIKPMLVAKDPAARL